MKDSIVNEVMEMVDIFLSLVTINLEDELSEDFNEVVQVVKGEL